MSKDLARSTGHVSQFFFLNYCLACKESTLKVQINLGFVTSFEDTHYILAHKCNENSFHFWHTNYAVVLLFKMPSC